MNISANGKIVIGDSEYEFELRLKAISAAAKPAVPLKAEPAKAEPAPAPRFTLSRGNMNPTRETTA